MRSKVSLSILLEITGKKGLEFICLLLFFPLGRQGVAVERQVLPQTPEGLSIFQKHATSHVWDSQPLQGTIFKYMRIYVSIFLELCDFVKI